MYNICVTYVQYVNKAIKAHYVVFELQHPILFGPKCTFDCTSVVLTKRKACFYAIGPEPSRLTLLTITASTVNFSIEMQFPFFTPINSNLENFCQTNKLTLQYTVHRYKLYN